MQKISNIIIILLITCSMNAQVYQAYLDAADKAFETKDYRTAVSYYGDAIELDTEVDVEVLSKYAKSAKAYQAYNKAKSAYLQILEDGDENLKMDAQFQLGELNMSTGNYDTAKQFYEQYLEKNDKDEVKRAQASMSLENITWALAHNTKDGYVVEKLGDEVNTQYSEMSPIEINDTLFFSSNNYFAREEAANPKSKIYTQIEEQSSNLKSILNDADVNIGHYTMNSSKTIIYFTKCNFQFDEVKCKIFKQDEDGVVRELPANINSANAHNSQPNIGIDATTGNEVLYFVSDRSGGLGGTDIYYSPLVGGRYQGPFALENVNTSGNELSPFYHSASNKLYYSTDGRASFGGLDIYVTQMKETWGEPINLGDGLNSSYNDVYFSLNDAGTKGYFTSNRIGSSFIDEDLEACCYDIYKATVEVVEEPVTVMFFDENTKEPIPGVSLSFSALPIIEEELLYDEKSTEYQFNKRTDLEYNLLANKDGYEKAALSLDVGDNTTQKIFLKPAGIGLLGRVIDENGISLSDFNYTLSAEKEKGSKRKVENNNKIIERVSKNNNYTLKVEKDGYYPEIITISEKQLQEGKEIDLDIILRKLPPEVLAKLNLDGYLPMPLYFDNDEPDQNTNATSTNQSYHETYLKYIARREEYVTQNLVGKSNEERLDVESKVNFFFKSKVTFGDESIGGFTQHLYDFLKEGSTAEIMVRGYASPRWQSDYNDALTSRRVRSVENYFYQWNGGALMTYINSGQLKLTEMPLGESLAPAGISDELSDKQGSIYSIEASTERRVEILEIKSSSVRPY